MMNDFINLICLVGRTGSGKSTTARALNKTYFDGKKDTIVRSYTTRPQRPGEEQTSDHKFIQPKDVDRYRNEIIAYTKIGQYEYFATLTDIEKAKIYVIDPIGITHLKENLKQRSISYRLFIVYLYVDADTRTRRLLNRGDSIHTIQTRNQKEENEFTDFENSHTYNLLIDGGHLPVSQICKIIYDQYSRS